MIINRLHADNVLKYSVLVLSDIPKQGLIAVVGDNESGKSSIGESICFGLFGRTFSLEPKDLDKVIRWGESHCSIKLDFTTPDGQCYQIARFLDDLGNHGASISRLGEEPMVRGVDEVEASLKGLIGFGYTEFVESFYLAQREITTPHPHSYAVKAMAGVDALESVVPTCHEEIARTKESVIETEKQAAVVAAQIATLEVHEGYLESLVQEREAEQDAQDADFQRVTELRGASEHNQRMIHALKDRTGTWLAAGASFADIQSQTAGLERLLTVLEPHYNNDDRTADAIGELEAFAKDDEERLAAFGVLRDKALAYRARLGRLLDNTEPAGAVDGDSPFGVREGELRRHQAAATSSRRVFRGLTVAFLLLAVAAWVVWALLFQAPHMAAGEALGAWLSKLPEDWQSGIRLSSPYIAGFVTLGLIAFWTRSVSLSSRLRAYQCASEELAAEVEVARREHEDLGELDGMPLLQAIRILSNLREEQVVNRVAPFVEGPGAVFLDPEEGAAYQRRFGRMVVQLERGISEINTAANQEVERLTDAISGYGNGIAGLDVMIEHEQERVRKHRELTEIAEMLRCKLDESRHGVQVRELAIELLSGAAHYVSQRFNHEVRNLSANSLPKFTNARYEHLQIDENLRVKAFSNEKRDFMDLDEISSGTQRQIMLAIRLALSQKLVNSVIQGPQMVFLDEPFAFFDERRTASSLAVLPKVSSDFTQIWVTSQTFPKESHFDMYVECTAEETRSPVVRWGTADVKRQ